MFVLFDIGENIDLIDGTLLKLFILFESPDFNNFDCVLLGIEFVSSSVYFSVGTFAYDLVKSVVFDNSDHFNN